MERLGRSSRAVLAGCVSLLAIAEGVAVAAEPSPFGYTMRLTPIDAEPDPAITGRYSPEYRACEKEAHTTNDTAVCYEDEFKRQDARLNASWRVAFGREPASLQPALRQAQRRWAAERNPFCRTESGGYNGGTIAPVIYSSCRVEATIRRTIWLDHLR